MKTAITLLFLSKIKQSLIYKIGIIFILLLLSYPNCVAMTKEIALTIDDLPFVGTNSNDMGNLKRSHNRFMNILQSLIDAHIPATGFIIANSIGKGQWQLLEAFRNAGFELGNHTYSHPNLNHMTAAIY